jgi:hypothetical protein
MTRGPAVLTSLAALLVLVLTLTAAACGTIDNPPGGDGTASTTSSTTGPSTSESSTTESSSPGSSTTTAPADAISHPTGADEVVIRVATGGGFVPIEYNYTMVPEFTLYGDGRIIVPGPTTLQYPGPALPNLQTTVVSEETVQAILATAKEAGLFQNGVDYGTPGVADVGTTTITVNAEGSTYASQIYALGFEDGGNLTLEQQQARAAVKDLQGKLSDPSTLVAADLVWEPFDYQALTVYNRPIDPTVSTGSTDIQPNHLPWPLDDLATSGAEVPNSSGLRKVIVSGDDLETLKPLLDEATQITVWKSGNTDYNLWFRPLLPDEAAALIGG